jgi:hypothetical protein
MVQGEGGKGTKCLKPKQKDILLPLPEDEIEEGFHNSPSPSMSLKSVHHASYRKVGFTSRYCSGGFSALRQGFFRLISHGCDRLEHGENPMVMLHRKQFGAALFQLQRAGQCSIALIAWRWPRDKIKSWAFEKTPRLLTIDGT